MILINRSFSYGLVGYLRYENECDQFAHYRLNFATISSLLKIKVLSGRGRREFNLVSAAGSRSDLSPPTRKRSREFNNFESSDNRYEERESSGFTLAELYGQKNSSRRVRPTLSHVRRPGQAPKQPKKLKAQYEYVSLADTVHHMHKLVNIYAVRNCLCVAQRY